MLRSSKAIIIKVMARYSKISQREREELLKELSEALAVLKKPEEIEEFLTDLLTPQERIMLAKRIKVAKLLLEKKDYREIEKELKVSHATIAKIAFWLTEGGRGFKKIAERVRKLRK